MEWLMEYKGKYVNFSREGLQGDVFSTFHKLLLVPKKQNIQDRVDLTQKSVHLTYQLLLYGKEGEMAINPQKHYRRLYQSKLEIINLIINFLKCSIEWETEFSQQNMRFTEFLSDLE